METKKIIILAIIVLLLLPVVTLVVSARAPENKGPKEPLEKIEFIHYKKGFVKPTVAKALRVPVCYKLLGVKWKLFPVSYVINPTNSNLNESFVATAIFNAAEEWDKWTLKELMDNASLYAIDNNVVYGVQDYKNAITFGNYPEEGVIAVTTVWYNPRTKAIVEFDIEFDTDWTWGDAMVECKSTENFTNTTCEVMDLQNIATHELGHGIGLNDVYGSACSEVTMYGYSNYGEVKKRTLEQPDITGLQTLYEYKNN
jgi:hypothetical protein